MIVPAAGIGGDPIPAQTRPRAKEQREATASFLKKNDGHPFRDDRLAYVRFYELNLTPMFAKQQVTRCNSAQQLLSAEVAVTHHLHRFFRITASYDRCNLFPRQPPQETQPENHPRLIVIDALNKRHNYRFTGSGLFL